MYQGTSTYLLKLDSDDKVLTCEATATSPAVLTRLTNDHMLSHTAVPVGHTFDSETRSFIAPPAIRQITRLAFLQRITMAEHVAIELASIHNPSAPQAQQIAAATLRKMLQLVNAANWIDLDREDTRAMVLQIEQMGLLATGRALQILDAEILPIEMPQADTPRAVEA